MEQCSYKSWPKLQENVVLDKWWSLSLSYQDLIIKIRDHEKPLQWSTCSHKKSYHQERNKWTGKFSVVVRCIHVCSPRGILNPPATASLIGTGSCCSVLVAWAKAPLSCWGMDSSFTFGDSISPSMNSCFILRGPSTVNLLEIVKLLSIYKIEDESDCKKREHEQEWHNKVHKHAVRKKKD